MRLLGLLIVAGVAISGAARGDSDRKTGTAYDR
jgi:hypothetical protein